MNAAQLPQPTKAARLASETLQTLIRDAIDAQNGSLPFRDFMQLAMYAPQYGYYTGGSHKIGASGDFITAPTISPLFGQTLARQIAALLPQTDGNIYEFGAGTGALAATLLNSISPDLLKRYYIIELSPELAERQREYVQQHAPEHAAKLQHLNALPEQFDGILIGNEVLDAMPVELVRRKADGSFVRLHVCHDGTQFALTEQALDKAELLADAQEHFPHSYTDYTSELHPEQHAFVRTLAHKLKRGAMIWIDYGFDAAQYYHPQRTQGTLIGHYRHHTVNDPFFQIGLTDLTAHVNFTGIAQTGCDSGLDLIGYTSQAFFLLNLGITELLSAQHPDSASPAYIQAAAALHTLTAQHEMGELFKVMAFGKNIDVDWQGFAFGDMCHKL